MSDELWAFSRSSRAWFDKKCHRSFRRILIRASPRSDRLNWTSGSRKDIANIACGLAALGVGPSVISSALLVDCWPAGHDSTNVERSSRAVFLRPNCSRCFRGEKVVVQLAISAVSLKGTRKDCDLGAGLAKNRNRGASRESASGVMLPLTSKNDPGDRLRLSGKDWLPAHTIPNTVKS